MAYRSHQDGFIDPQDTSTAGFVAAGPDRLSDPDRDLDGAVRLAQEGDPEAIRYLYVRFKDNVYGYVLSIVRDADDAEDLTQHVFLKLIGAIRAYEPRATPFASWLLRVARNAALDHLRRRRWVPSAEVRAPGGGGEEPGSVRRWGLEQALAALPAEQRRVIVLRHLVGLSPGEIAERLGRSEAAVNGLQNRARSALRRELTDAGCAPTVRPRRPDPPRRVDPRADLGREAGSGRCEAQEKPISTPSPT